MSRLARGLWIAAVCALAPAARADETPAPAEPPPQEPEGARPVGSETRFQLDVRFGGFYAKGKSDSGGAGTGGFQMGLSRWVGSGTLGFLFLAGVEGGVLAPTEDGTAIFAGEAGVEVLLSGDHRKGVILSGSWAPRVFVNFVGGEVASPFGFEAALDIHRFKIPLWVVGTLDGTTFFGGALAYAY